MRFKKALSRPEGEEEVRKAKPKLVKVDPKVVEEEEAERRKEEEIFSILTEKFISRFT